MAELLPGLEPNKKESEQLTHESNGSEGVTGSKEGTTLTPSEVISSLGFGRAQFGIQAVFASAYFSQFMLVNMMAYLSTRLYVELGLTSEQESILSVSSYSGFAASHLFWGWVGDQYGRRKYALASAIWIVFWSLLCVIAPSYGWLVGFRFLYSLAGGATTIIQPAMYELIPTEHHWTSFVVGNECAGATARSIVILVAYLVFNEHASAYAWRVYLFIMSIPALLHIAIVALFMYETPRYLLSKGKTEEAIDVLQKIALKNGRNLPENLDLVLESELAGDNTDLSFYQKITMALKNGHIRRTIAGNIMIGIAVRYFVTNIHFVKTELIFLNGQTNADYCDGAREKTYFLEGRDYLFLLVCQASSDIVSCVCLSFQNRLKIGLRLMGVLSYGFCFLILSFLFMCPNAWVAVVIISIVQIFNYNIIVKVMLTLSGLLPTNIRTTLMGISVFVIYLPLPAMPYAVQTLAKLSLHYVTGLSLGFCVLGFVGSAILPNKIYAN
ncbi:synaptic vesicle 2-related protein-like isoform X2 [Convolutriloba macropyga]